MSDDVYNLARSLIGVSVFAGPLRVAVRVETQRTIGHDQQARDAAPERLFVRLAAQRGDKHYADVTLPRDIDTTIDDLAARLDTAMHRLGQTIPLGADEYANQPGPGSNDSHFCGDSNRL